MTRLVVATLLLVAVALFVRFRVRGGAVSGLRVVSRAALNRSASVAVVEVEGRRLLVGAGTTGVHLLTELPGEPPRADQPEQGPASTEAAAARVLHRSSPVPTPAMPARRPLPASSLLDRVRSMTVRTADPDARRRVAGPPMGRS